jgi:hypothetical protein
MVGGSVLTRISQFAELLSAGYEPNDASLIIYGTKTRGNTMMQRIRKSLGVQAR